jgi:hypothetical protein
MQTVISDNQTQTLPAGSVADMAPQYLVSLTSAESTAEIPFGRMVQYGVTEQLMLVLAGASPVDLAGILTTEGGPHVPELSIGDTGLKPKFTGRVMRKGVIWVFAETGNAPGDEVHVRHTIDTGKLVGNFTKTADSGKSFEITNGARWAKTTTAEGLTMLEIDMVAMTITAD